MLLRTKTLSALSIDNFRYLASFFRAYIYLLVRSKIYKLNFLREKAISSLIITIGYI
ncbi:unnamed protein product [Cercospora beticola]|nr:unnamed protein product [Cercospora beticola]